MLLRPHEIAGQSRLIRNCSIWRALDVVGDVPTLLLLQALWLQEDRFGSLQRRTGLTKLLLTERIRRLLDLGLIERHASEVGTRPRYRLRGKGNALFPITLMLHRWETRWSTTDKRQLVSLVHQRCGHKVEGQPICGQCHLPFDVDDVEWTDGPGMGLSLPRYTRRRQSREKALADANDLLFTDSVALLGDRWACLVLRSVMTGIQRYDEIQADTAIATNILSERLKWLSEIGALSHRQAGPGERGHEYLLTQKGLDFFPVMVMLQQWGDAHCASPEGPPVILRHSRCGQILAPTVSCSYCHEIVGPTTIDVRIGSKLE